MSSDDRLNRLLLRLADGEFHSGEELGALLGVSRAAVWKLLQKLSQFDLAVDTVKGTGYRLCRPLDLLDEADILAGLSAPAAASFRLELHRQTASTNALALAAEHGQVFLAERQTAGRGRRGRPWVSPFAANIYLSLVWGFSGGASALSGLSLAVGVACVRVLRALGVRELALKWPNDLWLGGRKLGGILLEMVGDPDGDCQVVVGLGLNVAMPADQGAAIDQAWTDLARAGCTCRRSQLVAALLNELHAVLDDFARRGFAGVADEWRSLDAFVNRPVLLSSGSQAIQGIARGVSDLGALLVEVDGRLCEFHGGELSLRRA